MNEQIKQIEQSVELRNHFVKEGISLAMDHLRKSIKQKHFSKDTPEAYKGGYDDACDRCLIQLNELKNSVTCPIAE